jgi:hypothetical protein
MFDCVNDARHIRARIDHPDLALHRECMRAFLHNARAFAVVLTDNDNHATLDASRCEIRQGIARDIGANR